MKLSFTVDGDEFLLAGEASSQVKSIKTIRCFICDYP